MRTLTVSGEPGITPRQAIALINQVNQPSSPQVRLRTPLSAEDARTLDEVQAWNADVRSRQAGVHLLIEGTLIDWLAEATTQPSTATPAETSSPRQFERFHGGSETRSASPRSIRVRVRFTLSDFLDLGQAARSYRCW